MAPPGWIHLTARVSPAAPPLTRADTGAWLWTHLRATFPLAIAVVLMPDHPHIVVHAGDPEAARVRLCRLLGQFGRRFGVFGRISRVPEPEPIRLGLVLARQVRYVALNPCRARLAACPLAWPWSTHRDVVGAIADSWIDGPRLARALGVGARDFVRRHHAYVSGDPHARIEGTALPTISAPDPMRAPGLDLVAEACASATRRPIAMLREHGPMRDAFVALAVDQNAASTKLLAELCDCTQRGLRKIAARADPRTLQAARLCLADERLRIQPEAPPS